MRKSFILLAVVIFPLAAWAAPPPCGDMVMPVPALKAVGRGFGAGHTGIDLLAPHGTPVRAAAAGTVVYSGWWFGYGNMIDLRHPDGMVTRYAHLAGYAPGLHPGAPVAVGAWIGNVGATGHATTPHLHFEVRIDGRPVDPKPALSLVACQVDPAGRVEEARAR